MNQISIFASDAKPRRMPEVNAIKVRCVFPQEEVALWQRTHESGTAVADLHEP